MKLIVAAIAFAACSSSYAANFCNNFTSVSNPYPCCDNNNNGKMTDNVDGNCTWWAWKSFSEIWGHNLPATLGNAGSWAANAAAGGYAVANFPIIDTIASGVGHVARVAAISGGNVTLSEMNCFYNDKSLQGNNRVDSAARYRYITPVQTYDFWISRNTVSTSASIKYSNTKTNFDAQFKVRRLGTKGTFKSQRFMLSVHKSDSTKTWVRDFVTSTGAVWSDTRMMPSGSIIQSGKLYTYFNYQERGLYLIIPKMQVDGKWVQLGQAMITVK